MAEAGGNEATQAGEQPGRLREARYHHSGTLPAVLAEAGCSLLVSTYQAGKLIAIGMAEDDSVHFSFHGFDQAMGVAVAPERIAVGARGQIWLLGEQSQLAPGIAPAGRFDRCFLARGSTVTGGIHCHDVAWGRDADGDPELWIVNTLFSCLAGLHPDYSFVPRWRPPFISALAGQDRCHMNGLAIRDGKPGFVSVMAASDEPGGWRERRNDSGLILDVESGEAVSSGFSMPHSPRWHDGRLYVLNSGLGLLEQVDLADGSRTAVAAMPGYTRGLALHGGLAFVGLSRIRETAIFGGAPIAAHHDKLKAGVGVVDLGTGNTVATLEFETGIEEIFAVEVLPDSRCAALAGAPGDHGQGEEIWVVPRPDELSPAEAAAPSDSDVARWIAEGLDAQRRWQGVRALELFERAASARPNSAEILNHLGNALQDAGDQERGLDRYERAIAIDPEFAPAFQNAGHLLVARGRVDDGVERLRRADELEPAPVNKLLIATALPTVYASGDDLSSRRSRIEHELGALAEAGLEVDTTDSYVPTNFLAAYHGHNDRSLQRNLGRIVKGVDLSERPGLARRPKDDGRPRIGFLSAHFRDHTIGRLNVGRVERIDRERFELVVLSAGSVHDEMSRRFEAAADRFVQVPRGVAAARQAIAAENLDLLLFTDVGMDVLTWTLAFSRMAPVQAVTWGHPVTTGSPHMDHFISSALIETAEADSHYSERLQRLPSLGTFYERPAAPDPIPDRSEFGFGPNEHVYACPQTLFKLQPDFDAIVAEILRGDPDGVLVLIEGRARVWADLLRERMARTMPDLVARIRWLEPLPRERFLRLLASADVVLDPTRFGGGNTTYEALAMGTPVVSLPGELLRNRITLGLCEKVGLHDLIVDSPERYVELALALGTNSDRRHSIESQIAERAPVLFEDEREVRDLEDCLAATLG